VNADPNTPGLFDREWISRTLTELISHLGERYRHATERRLNAIGLALGAAAAPPGAPEQALTDLRAAFAALDEHIGAHAKLEFDLLFPAIIALEHPQVLAVRQPAALVHRLADEVSRDHVRIRELLTGLETGLGPLLKLSAVQAEHLVMLVANLTTLVLQLRQQLDFEDRFLWPRAVELFRQLS
jgi:iron-sulfur cluster repair protein YtfE (RIC family)